MDYGQDGAQRLHTERKPTMSKWRAEDDIRVLNTHYPSLTQETSSSIFLTLKTQGCDALLPPWVITLLQSTSTTGPHVYAAFITQTSVTFANVD